MEGTNKRKKIFYGWVVVAGCMMMRLGLGIPNYSMSVFLKPLCDSLEVSRGAFSFYSTFNYIATMIMLPILGRWFKKYSFKKLMWLGAVMTTTALFGYSFVTEVWHFYLLAALNGIFTGMLNSIPIAMLMANWFKEKRGFATGLAFTGSGISAMLVAPMANYLIENVSWMTAFRVCAALYMVFMFVPLLFIIKEKPQDIGLVPYGEDGEIEDGKAGVRRPEGFTLEQARKTATFWVIGVCMFLTGFAYMGTQNHVVAYLSDIGHSTAFASATYSVIMAFDTVGKIVLGALYDRKGLKKTNLYIYGMLFTSEVLLLFAGSPVVAIVFAVFLGMSVAVQTGAYPVIINTLLGDRDYTLIYGNLTVLYYAGMAVGVPFSGFVFDIMGSYTYAWVLYAAIAVLVVSLLLFAQRRSAVELAALKGGEEKQAFSRETQV